MVVARVAQASGRDFWTVYAAPYHLTLYAYMQLADVERIAALVAELDAVNTAFRMNAAMNAPKKLGEMRDDLYARLRQGPAAPSRTGPVTDDEKTVAAALFAAMLRTRDVPAEAH